MLSAVQVSTPMPADAKRGRLLLLIAAAITLFGDFMVISLRIWQVGFATAPASTIRWLLTLALFYGIWRGYGWVRWLMVGLIAVGLLLLLPTLARTLNPILIGVGAQFGVTLALLIFPKSVATFIGYQRKRYREST